MTSTEKIEAFLAEPRNVVVAGIRRDGSPHMSPNWFHCDGQRFYISTTRHRAKYAI
jgi:nitroimidazol reductase NimA-like FMN-containing flavoprotein (pyridoxamine 5'-phosphate oxidase superfamily)